MTTDREFQPRRASFLFQRIVGLLVGLALLSGALTLGALVASLPALLVGLPVLWIGLGVPALYAATVAYRKERYEIHADHLVCHRGSILSDGRTELDIHNITHVRLRLPWLRHRFWGIGDVRVESAGSDASEITFQSIDGPEEVFEHVKGLMRANGYSLQCKETLHEESPGVIGALTDLAQVGLGGGFSLLALFFVGAGITADIGMDNELIGAALLLLGAVGSLLAGLGALVGLVVRYLDITRRTYTVHEDAVAYTEGFLTRDNAVIPFENIADASTTRTVVDQVLGLYDVKVSCQGSGSEIVFRRLSRGKDLEEAIGVLVANSSKKARALAAKPAPAAGDSDQTDEPTQRKGPAARALVDPDEAWTATLKMHVGRSQLTVLPLILFPPAWIVPAIALFVRATRTTFKIGRNSMSSSYSFLGSNQQEFAYDKVTGVQVDRSPLDKLFNTLSVQIWSIGSPRPLNLSYLTEDSLDLPALLRQCGINSADPAQGELKQSYTPKIWAIQNVFALVFLAVIALGLVVAALLASPLLLLPLPLLLLLPLPMAVATGFRVKKQRVTFHAQHVEAQTGIFFRKHIYARYDNVKRVECTQIPFTDQGRFKLFVAGEQVQQQQDGSGASIKIPYSLQGDYIEGISAKNDAMDALMLGLVEPTEIEGTHPQGDDVLTVSRPAVANSVAMLALIGLVFPPLWLAIPVVAWRVKVRTYSVEADRVVERGGIFFKYATSVLFNRIDALQQNQGAFGKAFGNGSVTILTAGSSSPDLTVANVPDYQDVYTTIRKHYGKAKVPAADAPA